MTPTPNAVALLLPSLVLLGCGDTVANVVEPAPQNGGVDGTIQVKALSDEQATAWCDWYLDVWGMTWSEYPKNVLVKEVNGYLYGIGATFAYPPITPSPACFTVTIKSDCVRNLQHAPCEATIAEVHDCFTAWRKWRFDDHGEGAPPAGVCDYLNTTTNCGETVVHLLSLQPPVPDVPGVDPSEECAFRVE